jgi:penicillin-binding protein 1A
MVGGDDYNTAPFNLATQGQRQPGSSIKPFILARAYADGISPASSWPSHRLVLSVPHSTEKFVVSNFSDEYFGVSSLANALTHSDNSVFAQVGIRVGTRRVARLAHRMGIRTPLSHNWAMTLGGLKQGVTPLDMAHAYSTLADHGRLTYGSLSPGAGNRRSQRAPGPVGIESITRISDDKPAKLPSGDDAINRKRTRPVLSPSVADSVATAMRTVVTAGTGVRAAVPGYEVAGKTGTTENYGDAWFVGWAGNYTVAVWVGYPDKLTPMDTSFQGGPVTGGTFPAAIFSTFMTSVLPPKLAPPVTPVTPTTPVPQTTTPAAPTATPAAPSTTAPAPTPAPTTPTTPPAPTTPPPTTGGTTGAGTTGTTGTAGTGTGTTGGGTGAGGATPTG